MTFNAFLAVLGLTAVLLLIAAARNFGRRRIGAAMFGSTLSVLLLLLGGAALLVGENLRSYQRLIGEQPAGELRFTRIGYHQYNGVYTFPSGQSTDFELRGDEWQIDAKVLKWRGLATLLGFDAGYRLDRISGRYTDIDDEKTLPRTVFSLDPPERLDLWGLAFRYHQWLPWVDALYGSATYLPMADGARYVVSVSQSGLLARPANQSAAAAVGDWH